jgi:uncharacterized protein
MTLLKDETARFLVDHDVHISISLDGPQAIHDSSRVFAGGGGTYDRVIRQLQKLMDLDPDYCRKRLVIKCTIVRTRDISDLFEYFSQDPLKDLEVVLNGLREPVEASPESRSEDRSVRYQQIDQLMTGYLESVRAGKPVNHRLFRGIFPTVFSKIALRPLKSSSGEEIVGHLCIPGVNGIFVSADGRFFTCENFSHPENCIGSVESGIAAEKVRALLATYVGFCEEMCQHCWASRLCSQCFLHTLDQGRISKERMQENCAREREKIAKSFERFVYLWENEPVSFHGNQFSLHSAVNQA